MKKTHLHISFLLLFLFAKINTWAQCAMCRAVLESEEGKKLAEGVNDGITFLMVIPYILVAIVGYQVFKKNK
ncbi:hypothetical protein [Aquimarina agarilytica]|uniref:hypothetical protein n=1 Tax=Aquimarina agarilytica TaxID=1087449 RepID=UPI000289B2F5|nr:hypothetical protein [Aquimarina agarilytica]